MKNKNLRGLAIVPFWEYLTNLRSNNEHQRTQAQCLRNVGGPGGKAAEKKALKALARWPLDPGTGSGSPKRWKPQKRLQRTVSGKDKRGQIGMEDNNVLQRWLLREREGSEAPKTSLGPKKAKGLENL